MLPETGWPGQARAHRMIHQDHQPGDDEKAGRHDPDPAPRAEATAWGRRFGSGSAPEVSRSETGCDRPRPRGGGPSAANSRLDLGQARLVAQEKHVVVVLGQVAGQQLTLGVVDRTQEKLALVVQRPAFLLHIGPAAFSAHDGVGRHGASTGVCASRVAENWRDRRQNRTPMTPRAPAPSTIGTIQMMGNPQHRRLQQNRLAVLIDQRLFDLGGRTTLRHLPLRSHGAPPAPSIPPTAPRRRRCTTGSGRPTRWRPRARPGSAASPTARRSR